MTRSDQINELAAAMAKAQAEMTGAKKDSTNPHFNSDYADLSSVRDASLPHLNKFGLSALQFPRLLAADGGVLVEIETLLMHDSGQWISDVLSIPVTKVDAQGVGSAITYGRRYALSAITSVAPVDDDANAAVGERKGSDDSSAPAGAMSVVTVGIKQITKKDNPGRASKFTVFTTDGKSYSTIKKADAETAKLAQEAGNKVQITYYQSQWGRDIKAIEEVAAPLLEPVL